MRFSNNKNIEKNELVNFYFDKKKYQGYVGDTLASALLANNIHLIGRSFKYHRPRGIFTAGSEEPNGIVQLETEEYTEPNRRVTEIQIYEGLKAFSQNNWPSTSYDFGAINDLLAPFFPAGFYYKTFMWPSKFWKIYEYFIRYAAGLGKAPKKDDPHKYEHFHYHCDLLIVGSGISGLYSAEIAVKKNLKVLLIEQENEIGGEILSSRDEKIKINNLPINDWKNKILDKLSKYTNVKIISNTTCFAYLTYNLLLAIQDCEPERGLNRTHDIRQRIWKIRAKKVILATGAIERPILFNNNDRPGIMLVNSIKKFLNKYGVAVGKNLVFFTNNDSAYETALDFYDQGIKVEAIVDTRNYADGFFPNKAKKLGITILNGYEISNTIGRLKIKEVQLRKISSDNNEESSSIKIKCDLLATSGGWSPTVHLFTQSKGKLKYRETDGSFIPHEAYQQTLCVGSCNGDFKLYDILNTLPIKVNSFLNNNQKIEDVKKDYETEKQNYGDQQNIWITSRDRISKTKMFVDFQNDVTAKDIKLALKEGFQSIEHVKRYTTTGMATDQGKTSNINALGIISELSERKISELGTTTFRLPYTPVTFGALAGRHVKEFFDLERTTPMHEWHVEHNALFEDVGQWKRAWYYPKKGENFQSSLNREVRATRDSLGILDASTLGKIDIKGRDVSEFLNRVYTNSWSKLDIGKCRYGIMLGDDGMVIDDGVTARVGEYHYIMSTTTGNAASVMSKLEDWLQTEWPELEVYLTSVTEQYGTISLNGPNAKKLMNKVVPGYDFSKENFPHMSVKEINIFGVKCRVMRISFTGELCYEINVPAGFAKNLWEICIENGQEFNITPYGTEAMHVLRAEKGFIIVGQETDGSVTPVDLDMDWIVSKKKYDFVGKRALYRSDTIKKDRKQLVGLKTKDPKKVLEEGAQLVEKITSLPMKMVGHVTSSYYSPNLKSSFALALIKGGIKRKGEILVAPMENENIEVEITNPVFIDPENKRVNQ